jgi:hypothetical protein
MIYISKIYQKTQMMNIQVTHRYNHFVVANYAQYAINEFIESQNVQYAYVIGFSIKNFTKTDYTFGNRLKENIKQDLANQINMFFASYPSKLLFMSEDRSFFVLLKADPTITQLLKKMYNGNYLKKRENNDPLVQFEKLEIKPYQFQDLKIGSTINPMIGLYGIHDCDIFNLISNLETMIE